MLRGERDASVAQSFTVKKRLNRHRQRQRGDDIPPVIARKGPSVNQCICAIVFARRDSRAQRPLEL